MLLFLYFWDWLVLNSREVVYIVLIPIPACLHIYPLSSGIQISQISKSDKQKPLLQRVYQLMCAAGLKLEKIT